MCARLHAAPRASAAPGAPLAARWRGSVAALLLAALALATAPQPAAGNYISSTVTITGTGGDDSFDIGLYLSITSQKT